MEACSISSENSVSMHLCMTVVHITKFWDALYLILYIEKCTLLLTEANILHSYWTVQILKILIININKQQNLIKPMYQRINVLKLHIWKGVL